MTNSERKCEMKPTADSYRLVTVMMVSSARKTGSERLTVVPDCFCHGYRD